MTPQKQFRVCMAILALAAVSVLADVLYRGFPMGASPNLFFMMFALAIAFSIIVTAIIIFSALPRLKRCKGGV